MARLHSTVTRLPAALAAAFALLALAVATPSHAQSGRILLQLDPGLPPAVKERAPELYREVAPLLEVGAGPAPGDLAIVFEATSSGMRVSTYDAVSAVQLTSDELALADDAIAAEDEDGLRERARAGLATLASQAQPADAAVSESEPGEAEPAERPLAVTLAVAAGLGGYENVVPMTRGPHRVDPSSFAAAAVALAIDGRRGSFAPGLHLQYRTSIGHELSDRPPGGPRLYSAARVHEVLVDLVGNVHFGRGRAGVSLPIALGYATRNLRLDEPLDTPSYTLSGIHAGIGLRIPIADEVFVLTLGPDLVWFLHVSDGMVTRGFGWGGLAFGGTAEFAVRLTERFGLIVSYRESHAAVTGTVTPEAFSDAQRFVTAGFSLNY